jgi:hypothetical protein
MKLHFLLPNRLKVPALLLLSASVVLFVLVDKANFELSWLHHESGNLSNNNLTDELALSGIILSLLGLACCRERLEDEYVRSIRLQSWLSAILINYAILMLMIWTSYGLAFLGILFYNVLTPVIIYLLVFYFRLHVAPRLSRNNAEA